MQDKNSTLTIKYYTCENTIKAATRELRARCRKSEGFYNLLKLGAARHLKGQPVEYISNNPKAERALKNAIAGIARTEIPHIGNGPYRTIYQTRGERGIWHEIPKATADEIRKETTADSIAVREVIVYSSKISHKHAAQLDRQTRPQFARHVTEWHDPIDNRESQSAHAGLYDERLEYNDAGELETPQERQKRLEQWAKERRETWDDAERHISYYLTKTPEEKPERRIIRLPAAPEYHASPNKLSPEAKRANTIRAEEKEHRQMKLNTDAAEVTHYAEIDELLSEENLEENMLSAADALKRAGY